MAQRIVQVGRGTNIFVAAMNDCQRYFVEHVKFTVDTTAGDAADTTLNVTYNMTRNQSGVVQTAPAVPTMKIVAPFWLSFTETTGKEVLVKVTADVAAGASAAFALTVAALPDSIAVGATATFPSRLRLRNTANMATNDNQADVNVFENDGWADSMTTLLNRTFAAGGFYSPLDPGWLTCDRARRDMLDVMVEVHTPRPGCETTANVYKTGRIYRGHYGVNGVPIEIPSDGIITSNLDFQGRGKEYVIEPTV